MSLAGHAIAYRAIGCAEWGLAGGAIKLPGAGCRRSGKEARMTDQTQQFASDNFCDLSRSLDSHGSSEPWSCPRL
jgi:hypothetical protein